PPRSGPWSVRWGNRPGRSGPDRLRWPSVLRCHFLGHRYRFSHEGDTMLWRWARECWAKGSNGYARPQGADGYGRAFDREDLAEMGRRTPLGLLPLRLLRTWRLRRRKESGGGSPPREGS